MGNEAGAGKNGEYERRERGMTNLSELSVNDLKNAIWSLNNGMCPGKGIMGVEIEDIRCELVRRGESPAGYHEE